MTKENDNHSRYNRLEGIIKLIFRGIIPLALMASGITILALRMPGWSFILGLPLTLVGTVFLIYTYDEVVSKKVDEKIPPRLLEKRKDEEEKY